MLVKSNVTPSTNHRSSGGSCTAYGFRKLSNVAMENPSHTIHRYIQRISEMRSHIYITFIENINQISNSYIFIYNYVYIYIIWYLTLWVISQKNKWICFHWVRARTPQQAYFGVLRGARADPRKTSLKFRRGIGWASYIYIYIYAYIYMYMCVKLTCLTRILALLPHHMAVKPTVGTLARS